MLYLYIIWISFEISSNFDFNNEPFDQCQCIVLSLYGIQCTNNETENSFQNAFLGIPIPPFLIAFFLTSVGCHFMHSICTFFPAPITLNQYFHGDKSETSMTDRNLNHRPRSIGSKLIKIACCIATIVYVTMLMTSPYYTFERFAGNGTDISKSEK